MRIIGKNLAIAGQLRPRPLCIYGSETVPENAVRSTSLHFCITNAMMSLALQTKINTIFFGVDEKQGSCPGSRAWLGYEGFNPFLKYFVSTGIKKFPAEFLVTSPEIAEERLKSIGQISPMGKYTVIRACEDVGETGLEVKAVVCYGTPEQIRNLCMLAHFRAKTAFGTIQVPWGSSCGSLITYPAGLGTNVPRNCVFLGPIDPTDNYFFPPDLLGIAMPVEIASNMSADLADSFIMRRSTVAYPDKRADPEADFSKKQLKEFSERLFKAH